MDIASGAIIRPQVAHANVNSSQLVFDDGAQDVNSIKIRGPNQTGTVVTYTCLKTPNLNTTLNDWWWATTTYVYTYSDSNCSNSISPGTLWFSSDNAPYRCLNDTYPYNDWDCGW
jgi:hypothetical protein